MVAAHDFYENRYARFWISEGILFFEYRPETAIDAETARLVVEDRISFQNGRSLPVLCDTRGIVSTDKAGRDYLARSGSLLATAVALVVSENVSHAMGTFYLEVSKPAVPTRIFTDPAEALGYLKAFL